MTHIWEISKNLKRLKFVSVIIYIVVRYVMDSVATEFDAFSKFDLQQWLSKRKIKFSNFDSREKLLERVKQIASDKDNDLPNI